MILFQNRVRVRIRPWVPQHQLLGQCMHDALHTLCFVILCRGESSWIFRMGGRRLGRQLWRLLFRHISLRGRLRLRCRGAFFWSLLRWRWHVRIFF